MTATLYVEGGGDAKSQKIACQRGFRLFFERAQLAGRMPRIVACGSRNNVYDRFATALIASDGIPLLLVDAEGPIANARPWEHLNARDRWDSPPGATDEQCHLMVEIMESWFLADPAALRAYYGPGFREQHLPGHPDVEQAPKDDVLRGLKQATAATRKGRYDKSSHSFDILATLDPDLVQNRGPYARRFIATLRAHLRA